jgi:hypothetical protein
MSLATFKKKSINSASTATNISGKKSDKSWVYQGPYGRKGSLSSTIFLESLKNGLSDNKESAGFSINGSHNNNVYINTSMRFSKSGTPFRGQYPIGNGGTRGQYPSNPSTILYNMPEVKAEIEGNNAYVKSSVLSNKGMLERRYRWINSGTYPNYWVQPIYTGNQTDSSSQGLYIQSKAAANYCHYDVNNTEQYVDYYVRCGPNGCRTTPADGYKMVLQQSNAPYTKTIHKPKDSSDHTLRIQRRCQDPVGPQKPFPYRVQTGTGVLRGGINVSNVASACNNGPIYLAPPEWYIQYPNPNINHNVNPNLDPNTNTYKEEVINRAIKNYVDVFLEGKTH